MTTTSRRSVLAVSLVAFSWLAGCGSSPSTTSAADERETKSTEAIARFKKDDPGIQKFFDTAGGYAVFPSVGKGAFIIGGGYGNGVVYEKGGKVVGYSSVTFGSVGAQIGGQAYKEVIFFKDPADLKVFQRGEFEFDAQATAVAVKSGASAAAGYSKGVAIFVTGEAGLMAEASVAGQKFKYFAK